MEAERTEGLLGVRAWAEHRKEVKLSGERQEPLLTKPLLALAEASPPWLEWVWAWPWARTPSQRASFAALVTWASLTTADERRSVHS